MIVLKVPIKKAIIMESWMLGPPLLIGEKVFYTKHGFILSGTVKWLGRLQETFGNQMIAGILLVSENTVWKNENLSFRFRELNFSF